MIARNRLALSDPSVWRGAVARPSDWVGYLCEAAADFEIWGPTLPVQELSI